ncbi:MAG TPA: hypothetical protein VEB66_16440 [Opitutaceae bacterium]|nr:hypothetical protein [Opitutaceae bacterium]
MKAPVASGRLAAALFILGPLVAAAENKDHVLFMGTDLAVQKGDSFLRVRDVVGSSFMVGTGDATEPVPMRMRAANLKVEKTLKVATGGVRIDKLRGDRTFTPENDPRLKADRETGAAAGAQASADLARYQAAELEAALGAARSNGEVSSRVDELQRMLDRAEARDRDATNQTLSDMTNAGAHAANRHDAMLGGMFDAMEVEFELSSPEPIADPYIVIISRFREREAKAGVSRNWIYARSVGEIGPKPRYFRIREGGFPPGFVLEDYEVHVYDRGRELASNVSPKRVELTRSEAQQYLMIEHLAANKDRTVAAEPAVGRLPSDLRSRLTEGYYLQPYYVKVDESGNYAGVFMDAACNKPVTDPYLTDLFAGIVFKPALVKGKPAAGVCRVKLPELRL